MAKLACIPGGIAMLEFVLIVEPGLGPAGCGLPVRDSDVPFHCQKLGGRMPQC